MKQCKRIQEQQVIRHLYQYMRYMRHFPEVFDVS